MSLGHRLLISEQVADGMAAVHASGIIHRDLAARNIMVFRMNRDDVTETLVKVSDYGISTQAGVGGYLRTSGNTVAPVRYMPPEAIRRRVWTLESDIWSCGVLVWEIFSDGSFPYGDVASDEEVALRVRENTLRLVRPASCPPELWALVESCWAVDRTQRPSFVQIKITLQKLRSELTTPRVMPPSLPPPPADDSSVLVIINEEDNIEINLKAIHVISDIKDFIYGLRHIEVVEQALYFSGLLLNNDLTVHEFGISSGDVLFMWSK